MSKLKQAYDKLTDAEHKYDIAIWNYLETLVKLPVVVKIENLDDIENTLEKIKKRITVLKDEGDKVEI